jgi:hypothetical protein
MEKHFLLMALLVLNFSCSTTNNMSASVDIKDVKFVTEPYILNKNGDFFLVYQVAKNGNTPNVRLQISEKRTADKFYFFFIGRSSFPEYDHLVFRPVNKKNDVSKFFKSDAFFWLNPDATEVKLKIVSE